MTAYSTVCRAVAKAIALRTLQTVPSVDPSVDKGPIVDMVLAKVPNFVFKESTSLGLAATHASLSWPETPELDNDHKVRLVTQMDPILADEIDRLSTRLGQRLDKAQVQLKVEIGHDVQSTVAAIEGMMEDYQAGLSGHNDCEVVAFDWGALNNSDVIASVDAVCGELWQHFPDAVRSGDMAYIPALADVANKFPVAPTNVDMSQAINWPHLQEIGVATDTVDALGRAYRAQQITNIAMEQIRGTAPECVEGITKLSRIYNDLKILEQDTEFNTKYTELAANVDALRNRVLVGLGCGMIAQNSDIGDALILAYTPERLIVNGYTYATLENANPESLVQVADYLNDSRRLGKYGVTAERATALAEDAATWHNKRLEHTADQVKQAGAEFYSNAVITTLTEWARRQTENYEHGVSPRMAFEIDHLARDLNAGHISLGDGVMKLMMKTKASPTAERIATGIVGATESYGDNATGALESVAMVEEIMRSLLSQTLAAATYTD